MSDARKRICFALDYPTVQEALQAVDQLKDYVGMFKVGKELHTRASIEGINIFQEIHKHGKDIFFDAKFHDTPMTVHGAIAAACVPGVKIINVHVAGGKHMCQMAKIAAQESQTQPKIIGVTLLTSLDEEDLKMQQIEKSALEVTKLRAQLAKEWGLDGIVCPANKTFEMQQLLGEEFLLVTPGISFENVQNQGQKQLATPKEAASQSQTSILVVGSAIRKASNPVEAAKKILEEVTHA